MLVLVAAQALIAGQYLFGDWGIAIHGVLGNIVFTVAAFTALAAFLGRSSVAARVVGLVMVCLVTAQIGLGYSTRSAIGAASWHILLGVLLFGAAVYQLILAWPALAPTPPEPNN